MIKNDTLTRKNLKEMRVISLTCELVNENASQLSYFRCLDFEMDAVRNLTVAKRRRYLGLSCYYEN